MRSILFAALVATSLHPAQAVWPFKQNRFAAEALIDAGALGLDGVTGRVVAYGDWNGDQKSVDRLI